MGGMLTTDVNAELDLDTVTISDAQSLSGGIDIKAHRLASIIFPAGFASADITFQVSADETTWVDLYDKNGEVSIPAAAVGASRCVVLDFVTFFGFRYLKIRSGTSAAPAAVSGDKILTLNSVPR
jgi:hypothetical protein